MGWFSPLKGAYPGLVQIDKTLSVAAAQYENAADAIVRGSLIYVDEDGAFALASATQATDQAAYIYFALMAQDDFVAGQAGTVGFGGATVGGVVPGVARITGLACGQPLEIQTDQFDQAFTGDDFDVNKFVTVGSGTVDGVVRAGVLVPATTGDNIVGVVTTAPFERYINDKVAVAGRKTGAMGWVVNVRLMWLPGGLTIA